MCICRVLYKTTKLNAAIATIKSSIYILNRLVGLLILHTHTYNNRKKVRSIKSLRDKVI